MKLLSLCLSPGQGGLEIYVADAAAFLGDDCRVLVRPGSWLAERLAQRGVRGDGFEPPRLHQLPLLAARRLARRIEQWGIDVLHINWAPDLPLASLACKLARRRPALVYSRHMALPGRKHDVYHRWLYREVDRFIAVTRELAAHARQRLPLPAERILQLYPGVPPCPDAQQECGLRTGPFQLGLFGRIEPAKGQHLLIEALARLSRPEVHAAIVGHVMDEDYRRQLAERVAAAGLGARVRFHDFVPSPMACMKAFDAIVLTTENETFGLVLPEAMRCGVAVVGSDAGGVREIIDDGETGLLFRPGDAASLAGQLARLQDDAVLRVRLAEAGREKAEREFDRDTQLEKLKRILQDAALGRR